MKKVLSLILALIMVFALATTAFATPDQVVGNRGGEGATGDYRDGVDSFDTESEGGYNIEITVSASNTVSKYAVDVEYTNEAIQLVGSTMTWDVNDMRYEITTSSQTPDGSVTKDIKIINYSDNPVEAYAVITKGYEDNEDNLSVTANATADGKLQVAKANPGENGGVGKEATGIITISLKPIDGKSWEDVLKHYTEKLGGQKTFTVATATIYIVKPNP